jgi:hypothetical protein
MSFVKKCKRDTCANKAMSSEGKPLHGVVIEAGKKAPRTGHQA